MEFNADINNNGKQIEAVYTNENQILSSKKQRNIKRV